MFLKPYDVVYYTSMSVFEPLYFVVRLRGGQTEREGRLEIFHNDQWGTICDDSWDSLDATVACRSLGFSSGKY